MAKYRKKPVVIEAIEWTGTNLLEVQSFIEGKEIDTTSHPIISDKWDEYCCAVRLEGLKIKTLEGDMLANIGDYIIKGVNGEFYPCKPDIFAKTYEMVEP